MCTPIDHNYLWKGTFMKNGLTDIGQKIVAAVNNASLLSADIVYNIPLLFLRLVLGKLGLCVISSTYIFK